MRLITALEIGQQGQPQGGQPQGGQSQGGQPQGLPLGCLLRGFFGCYFSCCFYSFMEPQVPPGAIHIQPLQGCLTPFLIDAFDIKSA
jgi:hypothetical protein